MTNFQLLKNYYSRFDVQYKLISYLKDREFSLLVPSWVKDPSITKRSTRMLRCHNIQSMQYILNDGLRMFRGLGDYDEKSTPYNLYYSLAKFNTGIPKSTLNFSTRNFGDFDWAKEMTAYDFLIDIDAGDHEDMDYAHSSTFNVINYFDKNNIPYELRFSGKGYHIIIPWGYFSQLNYDSETHSQVFSVYVKIARFLHKEFSEMIDLGIYDSKRICKLPFSFANYEQFSYLSLPFTNTEQFLNFDFNRSEIMNINFDVVKEHQTKVFNSSGTVNPLLKEIM